MEEVKLLINMTATPHTPFMCVLTIQLDVTLAHADCTCMHARMHACAQAHTHTHKTDVSWHMLKLGFNFKIKENRSLKKN
jgi:hypothetical protein